MDQVLSFFTETLNGVTYWILVAVVVILLLACIGYLSERALKRKKKEAEEMVSNDSLTMNQVDGNEYVSQIPNLDHLKEVSIYPPGEPLMTKDISQPTSVAPTESTPLNTVIPTISQAPIPPNPVDPGTYHSNQQGPLPKIDETIPRP